MRCLDDATCNVQTLTPRVTHPGCTRLDPTSDDSDSKRHIHSFEPRGDGRNMVNRPTLQVRGAELPSRRSVFSSAIKTGLLRKKHVHCPPTTHKTYFQVNFAVFFYVAIAPGTKWNKENRRKGSIFLLRCFSRHSARWQRRSRHHPEQHHCRRQADQQPFRSKIETKTTPNHIMLTQPSLLKGHFPLSKQCSCTCPFPDQPRMSGSLPTRQGSLPLTSCLDKFRMHQA